MAVPETEGLAPEEFEIVGHKDSYRLAQRPGDEPGTGEERQRVPPGHRREAPVQGNPWREP